MFVFASTSTSKLLLMREFEIRMRVDVALRLRKVARDGSRKTDREQLTARKLAANN